MFRTPFVLSVLDSKVFKHKRLLCDDSIKKKLGQVTLKIAKNNSNLLYLTKPLQVFSRSPPVPTCKGLMHIVAFVFSNVGIVSGKWIVNLNSTYSVTYLDKFIK